MASMSRVALLACIGLAAMSTVAGQTTQIGQFTGMVSTYNDGETDPCIGSGKQDDVSWFVSTLNFLRNCEFAHMAVQPSPKQSGAI